MKKNKYLKTSIKLSLGIGILIYIIYKIGINNIINDLKEINPYIAIISILIFPVSLALGALNFAILVRAADYKIKTKKIIAYSLLSWSYGLFIPGKLGEFSIIHYLKKEKIGMGTGTAIAIIDKIITLLTLFLFSLAGVYLFLSPTNPNILTNVILIALIGGFIFYLLIISKIGRKFIRKYILRKYENKFKGFSKTFFLFIKKRKKYLILNFLITSTKWVLLSLIIQILLYSFNITPNFIHILLILCTIKIITLIPISINGLGVGEAIAIYLYSFINIPSTIIIIVFLFIRIVNYSLASILLIFEDFYI